MKLATKYIFIAIGMEVLAAIFTSLILFDKFNINFMFSISPPIIPVIIIGYWLGQKINYTSFSKNGRKLGGVLLMFSLLYLYTSILPFIFDFQYTESNLREVFNDIIVISAYTTLFGGIQTLLIGIWLGYKLSKITP